MLIRLAERPQAAASAHSVGGKKSIGNVIDFDEKRHKNL